MELANPNRGSPRVLLPAVPGVFRLSAHALVEEQVVLGGTGGQGALEVAGGRVEGEEGGLAGVGGRRGLALAQQVVVGAAELRRRGPWRVVHGGDAPQGICREKKKYSGLSNPTKGALVGFLLKCFVKFH